jgi:hypothetical protein
MILEYFLHISRQANSNKKYQNESVKITMKLLFYYGKNDALTRRLYGQLVSDMNFQSVVANSHSEFADALKKSTSYGTIIFFSVSRQEDIEFLKGLKESLLPLNLS